MTLRLAGIHHVSALSAHIERTHAFYPHVLGMRPVLTTVNQDDPGMYHLFYGDGVGSAGSDMTVFGMPRAAPEHRGNNSISLTTFRVSGGPALAYWASRLDAHGVAHGGVTARDGRAVLDFDDPVGTRLSLVDDGGVGAAFPWGASPVPPEFQIRGLGYPVITVPALAPTHHFLTEALGLRPDHPYPLDAAPSSVAHVYTAVGGADLDELKAEVQSEVHVVVRGDLPRARYGSGAVHHVALRVPDGQHMADWVTRLRACGYANSGVVDRHYFTSAYVREPNGVLFELATDGPGFTVDGPLDGSRLSLPPALEPRRGEIEVRLPRLPPVCEG